MNLLGIGGRSNPRRGDAVKGHGMSGRFMNIGAAKIA